MARVLPFFPRQTLVGDRGGGTTYYSEIFEVPADSVLDCQFRIYAGSPGAGLMGVGIDHTTDPTLHTWITAGFDITPVDPGSKTGSYIGLLRFVRARLTVRADDTYTIEFTGIAREST